MSVYTPTVQPLTLEQLPLSVHAGQAWPEVSHKYQFLSTLDVVQALGSEGILPYLAKQSHTRIEGKGAYTEHMIRFRQHDAVPMVGNIYPEIVLTNSHDRASSFHIELGLYRLICRNGMVANYGQFGSYRIRHVGSTVQDVIRASKAILELFPRLTETVGQMQATMLTLEQQQSMAAMALGLRWDADKLPFPADRLLVRNRQEDRGEDLWSTYNVLQENLIRGQHVRRYGVFGSNARSTREVKSIDMEMNINRGLWELASTYIR